MTLPSRAVQPDFDLAVVGSSFSGSLTAMIAHRLGYRVILLERGQHPRFVIGESSTPLAALLWESLAKKYDLPRLLPLSKWGTWQETYPRIGCGLKRGFTFLHHRLDEGSSYQRNRENELLVAASPNDRISDTHWYRPDYDHFLVQEAVAQGVEYLDQTRIVSWERGPAFHQISGTRQGQPVSLSATYLVDATGPRGFSHQQLGLAETKFADYPETESYFSHFENVHRWDEEFPTPADEGTPPYRPDDAALHHVFDDGWMWVLRFNNGLTSAGFALKRESTNQSGKTLESRWKERLARLPQVAHQFRDAKPVRQFDALPQLSFRGSIATGDRFVLLPMAVGFVDALLSTGFPLTLLGIERLGRAWESRGLTPEIPDYATETFGDVDAAAALVGALYANLSRPKIFQALTMLYFAAASYAETARRLDKPELASAFLLRKHPTFGPGTAECIRLAREGQIEDLVPRIARVIAPVNIAGLAEPSRGSWYPARATDLYANAEKLNSTPAEIGAMLRQCGFEE